MKRPTILVVNINPQNVKIVREILEKHNYCCPVGITDLQELEKILDSGIPVDLALIDITGFGREIWEKMEKLQNRNIPFIIISPKQMDLIKVQVEGVRVGAKGHLQKPLSIKHLMGLINEFLRENS